MYDEMTRQRGYIELGLGGLTSSVGLPPKGGFGYGIGVMFLGLGMDPVCLGWTGLRCLMMEGFEMWGLFGWVF